MAFPGKRVLPPPLGSPAGNEMQTRFTQSRAAVRSARFPSCA
jgi:hypothetical protein